VALTNETKTSSAVRGREVELALIEEKLAAIVMATVRR
jgi:hypothetical protein